MNVVSQFLDAIKQYGLNPPESLLPGRICRFPGQEKGNGNRAGWCLLFEDLNGGTYGDWSSGEDTQLWFPEPDKSLSPQELAQLQAKAKRARENAHREQQAAWNVAATTAVNKWKGLTDASQDHPYLQKKQIRPNGARTDGHLLYLPCFNNGILTSLQMVDPMGKKQFLKGGKIKGSYFVLGQPTPDGSLCFSESFSTGATIHESCGVPVVVCFNCGNLEAVVGDFRAQYPQGRFVIAADNDRYVKGNPGLSHANRAADKFSAVVAVPDFPEDDTVSTDFNDLALTLGADVVVNSVLSAVANTDTHWEAPSPISQLAESEPYPVDALPTLLKSAVVEVHQFVKAPIAIIANSAIGALSVACQAFYDVERANGLTGPIGLFLLTLADSGERKSTCDGFFTKSIKQYQKQATQELAADVQRYRANSAVWEQQVAGLKEKIKQAVKKGQSTHELNNEMYQLQGEQPKKPLVPHLLLHDETPESLAWSLASKYPSAGIISAEAGVVFGGHAMSNDAIMRNMAQLNVFWDGGEVNIGRRSSDSFCASGRLTMALQLQAATLREFYAKKGDLSRGIGFLARFLISDPESTQGQRLFVEPPEQWPKLNLFNSRILDLLNQTAPVDEDGQLHPEMLTLTPEAKRCWVEWHDGIEGELGQDGELHDLRDVASKAADNTARLAALFHILETGSGSSAPVTLDAMQKAAVIVGWHLQEAQRFFCRIRQPKRQCDAIDLENWMVKQLKARGHGTIERREVQRQVNPKRLRERITLDNALNYLESLNRVRVSPNKPVKISVNPKILGEG